MSLQVDADDVLIDHAWVWRADHGVEGFTAGASGDTDRWRTNTGRVGVGRQRRPGAGDRPVRRALPGAQHHLERRGRRGRALPERAALRPALAGRLDPPDGTLGLGRLQGLGRRDAGTSSTAAGSTSSTATTPRSSPSAASRCRRRPGVRLHHLLTVNLDAGAIEHVVNDVGARVDTSAPGVPSYVVDYPVRLTQDGTDRRRNDDGRRGAAGSPPLRPVRRLARMDRPAMYGAVHSPTAIGGGRA